MLRPERIFIVFLLVILCGVSGYPEAILKNRNILVLCAMNPGTPAYRLIIDGIRSELANEYGDGFYLHTEYLEADRYPSGEYPRERFELYNRKYTDVSIDLLICIGVDIIDPVKKNASRKILELPTITIDFDMPEYGLNPDLRLNERTTVLDMNLQVLETMNTALKLFPGRDSVFFICGTSKADQMYMKVTEAASRDFDKMKKYFFVTDISMDEVLVLVRRLSDRCIVVIPGFNIDNKGVPYYNPESVRLISQAAGTPVFAFSDMGFGDGAVGGYLLSFKKIGTLAGETAVQILRGTDPASIINKQSDMHDVLFDWRQLRRWNLLDSKLIPKESKILYQEVNFYEKYRLLINVAILFLLLQSVLIINLVRLYRRQKLVTRQLLETKNKFQDLLREDRILRLGQLTASLSHELNQPLTAILSTAQAGLRFIESKNNDPGLQKEILQNIVEDDKRAASVLSSIRSMLKLEKREKEKTNMNLLIQDMANIFRSEALERKISMEMDLTENPAYIMADGIQIRQVLLNLITNAAQAMENTGSGNRKIIITEQIENEHVTISVRDFGAGIDDSIRERLFRPFVTGKKEGTGIGLAISRSIVTDHGGKIWAENMPGGGATFSFSLKMC